MLLKRPRRSLQRRPDDPILTSQQAVHPLAPCLGRSARRGPNLAACISIAACSVSAAASSTRCRVSRVTFGISSRPLVMYDWDQAELSSNSLFGVVGFKNRGPEDCLYANARLQGRELCLSPLPRRMLGDKCCFSTGSTLTIPREHAGPLG